jgi:signal transduction histidine kinase
LQSANVLILTDDSEFARVVSSRWRAERRPPTVTVLASQAFQPPAADGHDLVLLGPVNPGSLSAVLAAQPWSIPVIHCAHASAEVREARSRHPRLIALPFEEDWAQTLLTISQEILKRMEAGRRLRHALAVAAQSEREATLGRYMIEMKHSVNNALTSILGNAELLLLEPGQLSAQSLQQIKTVHSMTLRLHEIMQRFSSLASEMREAEMESQAETGETLSPASPRP